jgi:AcrR family transcriptional regulator
MLQATISLIEEKGVEAVSIREATKRAGVSPGAPFRHFANKTALLTAVAEQAMSRLTEAVTQALAQVDQTDPIMGLRAIACGYLSWAFENPTHFQIISSRTLIDFHGSARLVSENAAIRDLMAKLIAQAKAEGRLAPGLEPEDLMLSARAFFYGLVRMYIDGHFQEWLVKKPPQQALNDARELFFAAITREVSPGRSPNGEPAAR